MKKYKVTLNGRAYEVEVENGTAMIVDEYEAYAPKQAAPAAPTVAVQAAPAAAEAPAAQKAPAAAPAAAVPASGAVSGTVVSAPMPGSIVKVLVHVGDRVKKSQPLLVLEAMKMENEINSPKEGTVLQIFAVQGAMVDSGAQLIALS